MTHPVRQLRFFQDATMACVVSYQYVIQSGVCACSSASTMKPSIQYACMRTTRLPISSPKFQLRGGHDRDFLLSRTLRPPSTATSGGLARAGDGRISVPDVETDDGRRPQDDILRPRGAMLRLRGAGVQTADATSALMDASHVHQEVSAWGLPQLLATTGAVRRAHFTEPDIRSARVPAFYPETDLLHRDSRSFGKCHRGQTAAGRHRRTRRAGRRRMVALEMEESRLPAAASSTPQGASPLDNREDENPTRTLCSPSHAQDLHGDVAPSDRRAEAPRAPDMEASRVAIYDVRGCHAFAMVRLREKMRSERFRLLDEYDEPSIMLERMRCFRLSWEWSGRPRRTEVLLHPGWFGAAIAKATSMLCSPCPSEDEEGADVLLTRRMTRAAIALQSWARRSIISSDRKSRPGLEWWGRVQSKRYGHLEPHVRFLQYVFRESRRRSPGCWRRGGLADLGVLTPHDPTRCRGGLTLAGKADFDAQKARAESMLSWYDQYVSILRRVNSGDSPSILHLFGGGGGSSEGGRRSGATGCSIDIEEQPDYIRRFGSESFILGDALSWDLIGRTSKKWRSDGCLASPPCKPYSRALSGGTSKVPMMIPQTRDALRAFFKYWAIENVMGATKHMAKDACELFGQAFGCAVDRARRIESSFPVFIDDAVRIPGMRLRARTCLGARRRWRRVDRFGRPAPACCPGNIFAIQGKAPWRCSSEECSEAMDVDVGHMPYDRLAQAIPPAYARLMTGQMCMQIAHDRFGVPAISYDEHLRTPDASKRALAAWLRGAGDDRAEAGLMFVGASTQPQGGEAEQEETESTVWDVETVPGPEESAFRELEYSHIGGFDQQWSTCNHHWLNAIRPNTILPHLEVPSVSQWTGNNTFIRVGKQQLKRALPSLLEATRLPGTRVTVEVQSKHASWLGRLGFKEEHSNGGAIRYMSLGRRSGLSKRSYLDHSLCEQHMDPRDVNKTTWADLDKRERSWRPVWWDPLPWSASDMPEQVVRIMTQGATIELERAIGGREVPQYPFPTAEARSEASIEADRAIATGHMSYVPAEEVETALATGAVHPWTIVSQGSKWRACQDYSAVTNRAARSAPFVLPTPWDVRKLIKPGKSRFAKYDLRDGFWGVPVSDQSKNCLMMRHPATGRLMRCDRLPFGYLDSPRIFCMVTESIAQEFRRRAAGIGCHIWCYVDDYLLMGDSDDALRKGADILEQILLEFNFEFAPHKQRGPCSCIEFLGLLLANFGDTCRIALSAGRQKKMLKLINEWRARQPKTGELSVDPRELAQTLGLLVFASQVVPGGRVYMQGMLSQFKGLEVDWARGSVRPTAGGAWSKITLSGSFWRDLDWWSESFEFRNSTDLIEPERGEAAITGTDASGWGTGQVAWIDGGKEESRLRFGTAECRRPINWRELLGIVRIIDLYGAQLSGRCVLVETDNMASKMAADRSGSKAEDMQELIRRLVESAERYDIILRFTHTPGVKLHRPDQTSRGDPIEEPRARFRRAPFAQLSARFGPFTELIGAERQHNTASGSTRTPGRSRLWAHPTFTTVGSTLRRFSERLMAPDGERASGIIIVPDDDSAQWRRLLRHFLVVGRLPADDCHLEMSRMGAWTSVRSRRPTLVLSFPRSAGSECKKISVPSIMPGISGDGRIRMGGEAVLQALKGSLLYSPGITAGTPGCLYIAWSDTPCSVDEDGTIVVCVAELLSAGQQGNSRGSWIRSHTYALDNSRVQDEYGTRPASFAKMGCKPWYIPADTLWTVDHLVEETAPTWKLTRPRAGEGQAAQWARKAFSFDFREAERELAMAEARSQEAVELEPGPVVDEVKMLEESVAAMGIEQANEIPSAAIELREAIVSAAEAAAARSRPPVSGGFPNKKPAQDERARRQVCRYAGMQCGGCGNPFEMGEPIVPAGDMMAHAPKPGEAKSRCEELAKQRILEEAKAAADARASSKQSKLTSEKKNAQLEQRFSDERIELVMKCLNGKCKCSGENRLMCKGARGEDCKTRFPCGRGFHATMCGGISSNRAKIGLMICAYCRAEEMGVVSLGSTQTAIKRGIQSMLTELSTGAEGTAKNVAEFERLEREFMATYMLQDGVGATGIREPRYSEESFIQWLHWLVTDAGRAKSLSTLLRMAGIAMAKLELEVIPNKPRVKAIAKALCDQIGTDVEPCTIPSAKIVMTMLEGLVEVCSTKQILGRARVQFDMETAGGCRVGEATNAGDGHGALAGLVDIATPIEGGDETINVFLEDSKTGFSRDVTYMSKTQGTLALECGKNLRELWKLSGFTIEKREEDGMIIESPDYWVVRVSLLGMSPDDFKRFLIIVGNTSKGTVAENKAATLKYARERSPLLTISLGEESRYVNIAGGAKDGPEVKEALKWTKEFGFSKRTNVVLGPFLRATMPGHPEIFSHMGVKPSSTYAHVPTALTKAWEKNVKEGVVDNELDLEGLEKPKFGHHANRRRGDKVANDTKHITGVTDEEIDDHFGWDQKARNKKSRLHYKGRTARLRRARVTMML